jgi:hypothetical protein
MEEGTIPSKHGAMLSSGTVNARGGLIAANLRPARVSG